MNSTTETTDPAREPCAFCGEPMTPGRGMSLHVRSCSKKPIAATSLEDRLRARAATKFQDALAKIETLVEDLADEDDVKRLFEIQSLLFAYQEDAALLDGSAS